MGARSIESARPTLTIGSLRAKLANPPSPPKQPRRFVAPGVGLSFKGLNSSNALQQFFDRYKGIGAVKNQDWCYITHKTSAGVRLTLVTPLVYGWRFEGKVCDDEMMAKKKSAATAFTQDEHVLRMAEMLAPIMNVLKDQVFEECEGLRGRDIAKYAKNSPSVTAEAARRV